MADCEYINECPFFNDKLKGKPDEAEELKEKYCRTNNLNCARYLVASALGKKMMPEELYPHEKQRAYLTIAENG